MSVTIRYSDQELEEFRVLIEGKLAKAREQLEKLHEQVREITENTDDEYGNDWFDDTSTNHEVDMLSNMAGRQEKYIQSLENALLRIRNKTYGICSVTGELIDKKRLIAVPTTTKSLEAKVEKGSGAAISKSPDPDKTKRDKPKAKPSSKKKPVIITRVIKKNNPDSGKKPNLDEDFDFLNEEEEENYYEGDEIDFDEFPADEIDDDQLEE